MRVLALLPAVATAVNILISNDDGWAELNIRQLYQALDDKGFSSVISAPAENQSGRGSTDAPPTTVDSDGCEFGSCPPGSPATGSNATEPRFNYVNSFPVTSVKYGVTTFSQQIFGSNPDLIVAGFNVGANLDIAVPFSGTIGAATEGAKEGIPSIAFSGTTGDQISWESPVPNYAKVYANLSATVVDALTSGGKPYLPPNVWLNVNFPASTESACTDPDEFAFILTRIAPAVPFISGDDVDICDNKARLPTERSIVNGPGCLVSISVGAADTKFTATADEQAFVVKKLQSILICEPREEECTDADL